MLLSRYREKMSLERSGDGFRDEVLLPSRSPNGVPIRNRLLRGAREDTWVSIRGGSLCRDRASHRASGMWPFIEGGVRRCLVRRFPYRIVYHHDESNAELLILAVMHLHREPYYWVHRN